jgi:hypothetical protein
LELHSPYAKLKHSDSTSDPNGTGDAIQPHEQPDSNEAQNYASNALSPIPSPDASKHVSFSSSASHSAIGSSSLSDLLFRPARAQIGSLDMYQHDAGDEGLTSSASLFAAAAVVAGSSSSTSMVSSSSASLLPSSAIRCPVCGAALANPKELMQHVRANLETHLGPLVQHSIGVGIGSSSLSESNSVNGATDFKHSAHDSNLRSFPITSKRKEVSDPAPTSASSSSPFLGAQENSSSIDSTIEQLKRPKRKSSLDMGN